jgi:2,3-dihydroxybiphenyl 1,2-dioxygenase
VTSRTDQKELKMSSIGQLCRVTVGTQHVDGWRDYATKVLGHEISPDSTPTSLLLRIDEHHHRVAVEESATEDLLAVSWQVADRAALQSVAARLEEAGVEVHAATAEEAADRRVLELAWFDEPHSGLRSEVVVAPERLFHPRVAPSRPMDGFVTDDGGLGHVAIFVPDLEAAVRFYVDVLGFGISDYAVLPGAGAVAAFLHCNARHHSLALFHNPAAARRAQHVMFETASMDDVGLTHDLCRERDLVTVSPGRHVNDRAFSFYFKNPSGWHFEYGWNPRRVDPATWETEHYSVLQPNGGEWGHDGLLNLFL